jgi:hypothetical protein
MKRYIVFAGYQYYPSGGWRDFCGDFDTKDEAHAHGQDMTWKTRGGNLDWYHVVDTETGDKVG